MDDGQLPPVTIIVEWENAIDVEDEWTARAMAALASELGAERPSMTEAARIIYLYDRSKVAAGTVERAIREVAPGLADIAVVDIVPTDGLSYYKLKNFGVARSRTPITVMLDSDAAPEAGWLRALLTPFGNPETVAVGGFTRLGHADFLSRAMALTWIFNLADEGEQAARRNVLHVNNCAVRTDFFLAHPFPDLPAFKKQCVFWLRSLQADGFRYVRTADARAVHAPHPGLRFLAWRAWTGGMDSDFVAFHRRTRSHAGRFFYSFVHFAKRLGRAWNRILFRASTVGMPWWERPLALLVALGYYGILLIAQIVSSLTRTFEPLERPKPLTPILA
jgi:hypothetical protein